MYTFVFISFHTSSHPYILRNIALLNFLKYTIFMSIRFEYKRLLTDILLHQVIKFSISLDDFKGLHHAIKVMVKQICAGGTCLSRFTLTIWTPTTIIRFCGHCPLDILVSTQRMTGSCQKLKGWKVNKMCTRHLWGIAGPEMQGKGKWK